MMKKIFLVFAMLSPVSIGYCQAPAAEPVNLVRNGDFEIVEQVGILGWGGTAFAATSSEETKVSGDRSFKLSSDREGFDPIATQDITTFKYGQKYRLQYHARVATYGQEYRVYIGCWDDSVPGSKWIQGIDTEFRKGLQEWQHVTVDFTIEKPIQRLMIVMETKGAGTTWFDQMSLTEKVEAPDPAPLSPYAGSAQKIQITPDLTFRVGGKPFFPLSIWGWHPNTQEAMAAAHDCGFNVVEPTLIDSLGPDGFRIWLDAAQKNQLMVNAPAYFDMAESTADQLLPAKLEAMRRVIERNKDHPSLFSYILADEPALANYSLRAFAAGAAMIRSIDPNHPIAVNHAPRNTVDALKRYNRYIDMAGSDIYPVWKTGIDIHSDLPNKTIGVVGDETTKNIEAVDGKKPVMQTLQGFSWSDGPTARPDLKDEPYPSLSQLRFMAYHTIVRGATGVAFFQDSRYNTVNEKLKPVVRELNGMSDILAGGKTRAPTNLSVPARLEYLIKEFNGFWVAIVVNPTGDVISGDFEGRFAGSDALKKVQVLSENRGLAVQQGRFSDSFQPWDVHIYTNAADSTKILRPFVALKPKEETKVSSTAVPDWRKKLDLLAPNVALNLARKELGVKAIASTELPGMTAGILNDGYRWGGQWNDGTHYGYPDWAGLEFPNPITIGRVVIYSHESDLFGYPASDGIRDFDIQVEEGNEWKTVKSIKGAAESAFSVGLEPPVTTVKLRLLIHATNGANDFSRIREIEVYAPGT